MKRVVLGLITLLVPQVATAADLAVAHDRGGATADQRRDARRRAREERRDDRNDALEKRRPDLEDYQLEPQRKGMFVGASLLTGTSVYTYGILPSIGHRIELGAGLTDRFTLGVSGGLTGHQGMRKGTAGVADLVGTYFPLYGLYVRAGVGVTSHAPWRVPVNNKPYAYSYPRRAGVGGIVGVGYEFRPLEHMAIALGIDYEGRVRPDGLYVQAVVASITMRAYFKVKD